MTKRIFAIVLKEPNPDVDQRMQDHFAEHFRYNDTFALVAGNPGEMAEEVALTIGLKGEHRVTDASGVVFKLNTGYAGYTRKDLWEWLSSVEAV